MRLIIREALLAFRRAPLLSALSVLMIAFSLFSFGLFALVAENFRKQLGNIEERVEISAYLSDSVAVETVANAVGEIARYPEVARAVPVSKEEALQRARRDMGEFRDVFDAEFLPASIEVRLKPGFNDPTTVKRVKDRIAAYPFVDDVRYEEETVGRLFAIRRTARIAAIALGLAFAAVAVIIIASTIRITVLARAREIAIMRLVGATDGFVRRPFLLEGLVTGVLGGALALLLVWVAYTIARRFIGLDFIQSSLMFGGIAFGGLIGLLGSAASVGRHLKRVA